MKTTLSYFIACAVCFMPSITLLADAHGAVHITLPDGEEEVDDGCCAMNHQENEFGKPIRPWYQNQKFEVLSDDGDPSDELQDETGWPGERVEFSDILFR